MANYKVPMQKALFLNLLIFLTLFCNGQTTDNSNYTPYKTAPIPFLHSFEKLTQYEQHVDSITFLSNQEKLQWLKSDTLANQDTGFSKEEKEQYIQYETKKNTLLFKENRTRFSSLQKILNNESDHMPKKDTLSIPCECYLKNDTIKIQMGIYVFRGFSINVKITQNLFSSSFEIDAHTQKIYKSQLSDSVLVSNLKVNNKIQKLILNQTPSFAIGNLLTGYLHFETAPILQSYDYGMDREIYSDTKMDTLIYKGDLTFRCRIRNKTIFDE